MKISKIITGSALLLSLCMAGSSSTGQRNRMYHSGFENVLGTSLDLKILAASEQDAQRAETAALSEIDREAKILSGYDPESEFSRWMRTSNQPVQVSPELLEVLSLFDHWREQTKGALDPSAETITQAWKTAAKQNRIPTSAELTQAIETVKQKHWALNAANSTVTHLTNAPLVLNSFAKSYIVNRAAEAAMHSGGVDGVVVNIGGDLVVRGAWTEQIDIADPRSDAENGTPIDRLILIDRAVATSGNYRRGVEINGKHYSHIVDPRTGRPADEIISSTVVSPNAATAGALATAFSILKPAESIRLAAALPDTEFLLIARNGARIASKGWKGIGMPAAPLLAAAANSWDPSMELTIHLDIARIDGFRARRPYVAAWIEDQDHFPVRTVALWIEKTRYLPEMKAWYKDDRLRSMSEGSDLTRSVSSATRPPGKYTLQWDGKDNTGKPVKAGKYTVMIEAAREHGTYQLIHQEMDFAGTPKQVQLPGGTELEAASLDYHKVAR